MSYTIYRGTTPPFTLRFNTVDLTGWTVYITFEQAQKPNILEFTVQPADLEIASTGDKSCDVTFTLTQNQTLLFEEGAVGIQMRAYKDGDAIASKKKTFSVKDIYLDGVIPLDLVGD